MKEKYYSIPNVNSDIHIVGAALLIVGALLSFLVGVKANAIEFWTEYDINSIQWLLLYVIFVFGCMMYVNAEKYGYKLPLLMILIGHVALWSDIKIIIATALIFITLFAFPFNKRIKFLKHIQTPWIAVIASVLAIICALGQIGSIIDGFKAVGTCGDEAEVIIETLKYEVLPYAADFFTGVGTFLIAFFMREQKYEAEEKSAIGQMTLNMDSKISLVGFFMILADIAFVIIANIENLTVGTIIPILIAVIAMNLIYIRRLNDRFWIAVLLMFFALNLDSTLIYPRYELYPTAIFFFLFMLGMGFRGNKAIDGKSIFSVAKIIVLVTLLFCLVNQVHMQVDYCIEAKNYITPLYQLKSNGFPFNEEYMDWIQSTIKGLLFTVPVVIQLAGWFLIILATRIEEKPLTIWDKVVELYGKLIAYCRNFFNAPGSRIKRLAKIWAWIYFVLAIIISFVCGIGIIAVVIMALVGGSLSSILPFTISWTLLLYAVLAIIGCILSALPAWFIYAYGQMSVDSHENLPKISEISDPIIDFGKEDNASSEE